MVYSKVLDRNIVVSWSGNDPKVVYVDRTPYTPEEISKLKGADPESVTAAHLLKQTFDGKIVDE